MTEAAQEDLTGMPTPNFSLPWTITNTHREHVDITDARGKSVFEQIRADYAALIVKAVNGHQARTWQPIETAPKDGTWILGWSEKDSNPARISWGRNHNSKLSWCTAFCSFVDGYITHWVPMPNAPEQARSAIAEVTG